MPDVQACLKHRYHISALLAGWSVLFRQTNAVWVCFIIGVSTPSHCHTSVLEYVVIGKSLQVFCDSHNPVQLSVFRDMLGYTAA